jgi:DNA-binding NarL/FixJ family response regulator
MKLLFVEDDASVVGGVVSALATSSPNVIVTVAPGAHEARIAMGNGPFDLVVCDRRIPKSAAEMGTEDEAHGDAILAELRQRYPGTPVFVLTAYRNVDLLQSLLDHGTDGDPFAEGHARRMIMCFDKNRLVECVAEVRACAMLMAELDEIEIVNSAVPSGVRLRSTESRLLRMFAKRRGGSQVHVAPVGGGLSSTTTFRVEITDQRGARRALAFSKIGHIALIDKEHSRYLRNFPALLSGRCFASFADKISSGAGDVAGLFYELGSDYSESLFDVVRRNPEKAPVLIEKLGVAFAPWRVGAASQTMSIRDVRRMSIDDGAAKLAIAGFMTDEEWRAFESRSLVVKMATQHRDLHGENVLVAANDDVLIIDYGDADPAPASFDFVVLELSALFHVQRLTSHWRWPSVVDAANWATTSAYCGDCIGAAFVNACRSEALRVAGGLREVLACAYSYTLRQLKYPDTDKTLALAVLRATVDALQSTYSST